MSCSIRQTHYTYIYIYIPHMELALTTKINEKILEEEVMHKIYMMKN